MLSGLEIVSLIVGIVKDLAELVVISLEDLKGGRAGTNLSRRKIDALDATLDEWISLVEYFDKDYYQRSLGRLKEFQDKRDKYYWIAQNVNRKISYPANIKYDSFFDDINMRLKHSKIRMDDGKILVALGASIETESLNNETVKIQVEKMNIAPSCKITLLGPSRSGKTVYITAMYNKMQSAQNGFTLYADDLDRDAQLRQNIAKLFRGEWPTSTPGGQMDTFDFTLKYLGAKVASINLVDYRGESVDDLSVTKESKILRDRLRESDVIIVVVDLSCLDDVSLINTDKGRVQSNIGRLVMHCQASLSGEQNAKSWLFVRTKSDEALSPTGEIDMQLAKQQLQDHLGGYVESVVPLGGYNTSALIALSSTGRIVENDGDMQYKDFKEKDFSVIEGDVAINVQWPILIAVASRLAIRQKQIDGKLDEMNQMFHNKFINAEMYRNMIKNFDEVVVDEEFDITPSEIIRHGRHLYKESVRLREIRRLLLKDFPRDSIELINISK